MGLLISGAIRVRDEMLLAACEFIQAKRRLNILKSIQSKFQEGRTKNSLTVSSYATAEALAAQVSQENYDKGLIYPPFSNIRKISAHIAANVVARHMNLVSFMKCFEFQTTLLCFLFNTYIFCAVFGKTGLASHLPRPKDLVKYAESCMYSPGYRNCC